MKKILSIVACIFLYFSNSSAYDIPLMKEVSCPEKP